MSEVGAVTQAAFSDPLFSSIVWKASPASFAVRLSGGAWQAWPYLQLLSRKLIDVAMGRCKRLIVTMPPRHGKSLIVSQWFPSWYIETFPDRRIILCSYEADFASDWGGKVRDIIMSNRDALNVRLSTKRNQTPARHSWRTMEGGGMVCAGVGGPITGRGANVFIIDDYVKNAEEAASPTMREKTWNWWTSTARTRIEPGGSFIIMATRWNSGDLVGKVLDPISYDRDEEREQWEVFNFPALAEPESDRHYLGMGAIVNDLRHDVVSSKENKRLSIREAHEEKLHERDSWRDVLGRQYGEALCPDRYNERDLALTKNSIGQRDWFSLYQQRPGDFAEDGDAYFAFDELGNCGETQHDERYPLFVSLDFNIDPMTAVIGQYDPGSGIRMMERCWILEEIVLYNSNTYAMCEQLLVELQKYVHGYTLVVEVYGDAAGTQGSANSRKTNWGIVAEFFALQPVFHVRFLRRRANPSVSDRLNAVNSMLKSADGTVRLILDDVKCPELLKDFQRVRMERDSAGNSTGRVDKSDGKRTHLSDALGYFVEYRFGVRRRAGGRKGMVN